MLRPLPFHPRTLLAPMEGLTSVPLRNTLAQLGGLGAVCTEFVCQGRAVSTRVARQEVVATDSAVIVQLLGNDPDRLAAGTSVMVAAGADGVDLNVGCPSSKVNKRSCGASLLKEPARLERLLTAMVQAAGPTPVSAKVRLGWKDPHQASDLLQAVEAAGCAFVTIHGRTYKQGYDGQAQLDLIARAREGVQLPVIANGDIVEPDQALAILAHGQADGVMLGRGALRNPWIFQQMEALAQGRAPFHPQAQDVARWLRQLARAFHEGFEGRERAVLAKLKEVISYLARSLKGCQLLKRGRRAQTLAEFLVVVDEEVAPLPTDALSFSGSG